MRIDLRRPFANMRIASACGLTRNGVKYRAPASTSRISGGPNDFPLRVSFGDLFPARTR